MTTFWQASYNASAGSNVNGLLILRPLRCVNEIVTMSYW
jgi:hypothetical protein